MALGQSGLLLLTGGWLIKTPVSRSLTSDELPDHT